MDEKKLTDYRDDVAKLAAYIPWLEKKAGENTSYIYEGNGISESTITFPVYDSSLMNFVNDAMKTNLMDRNYVYVYSRNFIKTPEEEMKAIEKAGLKDGNILFGILSKYVLGGNTKGSLWTEGVKNGVILAVIKKLKVLLEMWDAPLA